MYAPMKVGKSDPGKNRRKADWFCIWGLSIAGFPVVIGILVLVLFLSTQCNRILN